MKKEYLCLMPVHIFVQCTSAPKNKVSHCFHCFPIYLPWSYGTRCHNLSFLNPSYKPTFSFSSFTFIKRLFSSSLPSAIQFSSVQSRSRVWLFATPWITARQASLSITNSRSSLRLMSIESVMPSSHLILCCPLLLLPPIPPSISLFQRVNSSHEVAKVLEFQL